MTSSTETFIHFGCHHCTAPLKAPAAQAGARQRCPLCHWAVDVPHESRRIDFEEYSLDHDAAPWLKARRQSTSMTCPVCHTHLTAPEDQIGQEIRCPDCQTSVVVPPKPEARRRKGLVPLEEYALCEDYHPVSPSAEESPQFAVYCGLCSTLMYATPDEVGSTLTCPDCRHGTVVPSPPPRRRPAPNSAAATIEPYAVREDSGRSAAELAKQPPVSTFLCTCGTLLSAPTSEVGRQTRCPDCSRMLTVPPRARRRRAPDLSRESEGGYDVKKDREPEPARLGFLLAGLSQRAERAQAPPPPPPRWPLASGVFTFPWRRGTLQRWFSLSVAGAIVGSFVCVGWGMGAAFVASAGYAAVGLALVSLVLMGAAAFLGVCWGAVCAINLLVILWDTAAGNDRVEQWPETFAFADWTGGVLSVPNSLAMSLLPGLAAQWVLDCAGLPSWYAVPSALYVLFPLALMSMLEANSAVIPFSLAVFRSLWGHWRAWLGFYLETALLLAVAGGVLAAGLLPGRLVLAVPIAAFTAVTVMIIYFRLLGRVAWCCGKRRRD